MDATRTEEDMLGKKAVPQNALYGIHTVRALENFPLTGRHVHPTLIHAFGEVKLAAAKTNRACGAWKGEAAKADAIEAACREMASGILDEQIVVDALQGGAGTSTNMNVNEVLANRALQLLSLPLGSYDRVEPVEDVNLSQSTNDTYPTALRLAVITQLRSLENKWTALQRALQNKEKEFAAIVKIGRTEMQDAVLMTLGQEMGAYAAVVGRDRERMGKSQESLRIVNMGGTAIGTGATASPEYIARVTETLREQTGIGFIRAENMIDCTQNADVFVEISGTLKTAAASLMKLAGDLRLMSSGPDAGFGEIRLPERQAGSSIMPGKVNPVIPEAVTQAALRLMGYDMEIAFAASMGNLELNAFMPLIADALLNGIDLLANASEILARFCIKGIVANAEHCRAEAENSTALLTALVPKIGYEKAVAVFLKARTQKKALRDMVLADGLMSEKEWAEHLSPAAITKLGDGK